MWEVVSISDERIREEVLCSGEIVTRFTEHAEQRTEFLTGIGIDRRITEAEENLRSGRPCEENSVIVNRVQRINQRALWLVRGLIDFKERIIDDLENCCLFTFNYLLLVEHILREARMYCSLLEELETDGTIADQSSVETEMFWNQIMMEHALFIRGLLDPTEMV